MLSQVFDSNLIKDKCLIDGQWISSDHGKTIPVVNPFDHQKIAEVPDLEEEQINQAIQSAGNAFESWKSLMAIERSALLRKWNDLILANINDLATIMVLEQGKPLREAIGEIQYSASYIELYAEEAKRVYGDIIPSPFKNSEVFVIKQPIGVVGIITPWNFPAAMMARKIAPALACGCTCVIKPDEKTPLTALALAELAVRAGIPKGVVNFVTGNPEMIGNLLTGSKMVKKISFTGSIEVGKLLMKKSSDTLKKITLELGGNAPFIVFENADTDQAVNGFIDSKFRNAGQTCVCANRLFVHKNIKDIFISKLTARVKEFKTGNGLDNCDIGPLINEDAVRKVETLISDAVSNGAEVIAGGKRFKKGTTFFEPTIMSGVTEKMKIFDTEIFGPVVSVIVFEDTDEVIKMANNINCGLASYFYSNNLNVISKVSKELEYGIVGVNTGIISSAYIPFGGVKESGFGREGSRYGMDDYLTIKYINLKI